MTARRLASLMRRLIDIHRGIEKERRAGSGSDLRLMRLKGLLLRVQLESARLLETAIGGAAVPAVVPVRTRARSPRFAAHIDAGARRSM